MAKYHYECPMWLCSKGVVLGIAPSTFPTCNGDEGSHHKLMDFIEERSTGVPGHVREKYPKGPKTKMKAGGGNWR